MNALMNPRRRYGKRRRRNPISGNQLLWGAGTTIAAYMVATNIELTGNEQLDQGLNFVKANPLVTALGIGALITLYAVH